MPRYLVSTLVACRLAFRLACCLASLLTLSALATSVSGQIVWVDFTSDFQDGDGGSANGVADWIDELNEASDDRGVARFTAAERETMQAIIIDELARVYEGTNIEFVTSQPAGDHDVIYLGASNSSTDSLGVAAGDAGNRNTSTYAEVFPNGDPNSLAARVPKVFTGNFGNHIGFGGSREASVRGFANAIAGTAAHELGHSFGLLHHYVYSAEGISPDNSDPTNTRGLQDAHILLTGSSGNSITIRIAGARTLAPWSEILIDIAGGSRFFQQFSMFDNTALVDNPVMSDDSERRSGDAGETNETAQLLSFEMGTVSQKLISFVEADLDGGASDVDRFRLEVTVESVLSAHVLSEQLSLGNDEFDPTLRLLDGSGTELAFADDVNWFRNSFVVDQSVPNSDSSSSQDAALFNYTLAAGTYYLEVAPATTDINQTPSNGDIYWLLTSLKPLGVPDSRGDVNQDGFVNFSDIGPFIALLAASEFETQADINGDGMVNFSDIAPFIALLAT